MIFVKLKCMNYHPSPKSKKSNFPLPQNWVHSFTTSGVTPYADMNLVTQSCPEIVMCTHVTGLLDIET